jgi:hypothetical protein
MSGTIHGTELSLLESQTVRWEEGDRTEERQNEGGKIEIQEARKPEERKNIRIEERQGRKVT